MHIVRTQLYRRSQTLKFNRLLQNSDVNSLRIYKLCKNVLLPNAKKSDKKLYATN